GEKAGRALEQAQKMQSEFSDIEQRTRAFDQERQAIGLSAEAATKAKTAFRLLEAAKHAGIPITEELKAKVGQLATSYAAASTKLDEAQKRQETYQQLMASLAQASPTPSKARCSKARILNR